MHLTILSVLKSLSSPLLTEILEKWLQQQSPSVSGRRRAFLFASGTFGYLTSLG
ncbi:hypothetical protein CASFOL_010378 [Castilleja foliolosa]|uniref:Uncharacterized protein n=1 Tax=Castilleja foliolosa TaxID=1961234 RepID=A0ABD3DSX2_9LAMI